MRWMWIDRIVALEKGRSLTAIKLVSLAEEHLHDHFSADEGRAAQPVMPASLIIEGVAQTAGILVGHAKDFREKVILAKVGKAELSEDATPGCVLRYTASLLQMDAAGASTSTVVEVIPPGALGAGSVGSEMRVIGKVDLVFSHLDQNMAGQVFPEHNFVFGEGFKTLLRTSGF